MNKLLSLPGFRLFCNFLGACCSPLSAAIGANLSRPDRIIYVGPSLYGVKMKTRKGEVLRPPAAAGDIVRDVLQMRPKQIVLIDGVFHQRLAVWHKEIVYALLSGTVVIGAASMGALRAAEMHRYGAIGVGRIFEMYRDGEEDDALVAMTFDPDTYRPLCDSKVGQDQKSADALSAIEFARSYRGKPFTTLKKDAITPYLRVVLNRVLD